MKRAFTLIELLTVVAILGVLAGLLLPVLASAKVAGKKASCLQNLRSLHLATTLYQGDADDAYPFASDPFFRDSWCEMKPPLYVAPSLCETPDIVPTLAPYVKGSEVWHCPLDSGLDVLDFLMEANPQVPTSYRATGSSYWYNDNLALSRRTGSDLYDPVKSVLFFDRAGAWHGSGRRMRVLSYEDYRTLNAGYRYQAVHADGHVRVLTGRQTNFGFGAGDCDCRWFQGYQSFL